MVADQGRGTGPGMSGVRGAGAAAAAVHWRTRKQASEGSVRPQYNELLQILNCRIDRLAQKKEQWRRLAAGVEILTALLSFAEELQALSVGRARAAGLGRFSRDG